MLVERWEPNQQNLIEFTMIDSGGNELAGLLPSLAGVISKNGAAAIAIAGALGEITNMVGRYTYLSTVGEADTIGIVSFQFTAAGAAKQNLKYIVRQRTPNGVPFDPAGTGNGYRMVTAGGLPISGVDIIIRATNDINAVIVTAGQTNLNGYIRDVYGNIPLVQPGIPYYVWRFKAGYAFDNPDVESM